VKINRGLALMTETIIDGIMTYGFSCAEERHGNDKFVNVTEHMIVMRMATQQWDELYKMCRESGLHELAQRYAAKRNELITAMHELNAEIQEARDAVSVDGMTKQ
jgi:hypothetical protein